MSRSLQKQPQMKKNSDTTARKRRHAVGAQSDLRWTARSSTNRVVRLFSLHDRRMQREMNWPDAMKPREPKAKERFLAENRLAFFFTKFSGCKTPKKLRS